MPSSKRDFFYYKTREREKFFVRQPPIGEKDDYDSENSWISDGFPNSSRRRRRGEGRGEGDEWRENWRAIGVDVGVDYAKSEIKVERQPVGDKDDYDSENSWISDGLPSSSRRRRRGDGRGEGDE